MKTFYFFTLFFILGKLAYGQDGRNDGTFNTLDNGEFGDGLGFDEPVHSTVIQYDGKVIAGGEFTKYNGVACNRIARLNKNGSLDKTFSIGSGFYSSSYTSTVRTIVLQKDGKLIIGGGFRHYNGKAVGMIVRINSNGTMDDSFKTQNGFDFTVNSISLQNDGKIIVAGDFNTFNGISCKRIARLNKDGSLDTIFKPILGFNSAVYTTQIQSDGKIIAGGRFTTYNSINANRIIRIDNNGKIDTSFNSGTGFDDDVSRITSQSDGKLIIGGRFENYNGKTSNHIIRLNQDGRIDSNFNIGVGFDNFINTINIQSDEKILIGGPFYRYNGQTSNHFIRLLPNGFLDTSFNIGDGFNGNIHSCAIQTDDKIILWGYFSTYNGQPKHTTARLFSTGLLDTSFNPGAGFDYKLITSIAVQNDNKIIVGGNFFKYNNKYTNFITRLNYDGTIDSSFKSGTGFNNGLAAIKIQKNGKILIGGSFTTYNNTLARHIIRLNSDGSKDTSFNSGSGALQPVIGISFQNDGKIIILGLFGSYNGFQISSIARLNTNGLLDSSFRGKNGEFGGGGIEASDAVIQPDGKIIVVGSFHSYDRIPAYGIVRLTEDGIMDTSFKAFVGINEYINCVGLQNDGKVVIGGRFSSVNGSKLNNIARLNSNGSVDTSFNIGSGFNYAVNSIKILSNGKIIAGGGFTSFNNVLRSRILRLNKNGSIDLKFNPGDGFNHTIRSIDIHSDNKIIAVGDFSQFDSYWRNGIARLENCLQKESYHNIQACKSYKWINGKTYTKDNNTDYYSQFDSKGCDSTIYLNLTFQKTDVNVSYSSSKLTANATNSSYQWVDCDKNKKPILGETNRSYTPTAKGNYAVIVTTNSCTDTSACIATSHPNKIFDDFGAYITIFPNPTKGELKVDLGTKYYDIEVIIRNEIGQVLLSQTFKNTNTLNLFLPFKSGIYFFELQSESKKSIFKVFKE